MRFFKQGTKSKRTWWSHRRETLIWCVGVANVWSREPCNATWTWWNEHHKSHHVALLRHEAGEMSADMLMCMYVCIFICVCIYMYIYVSWSYIYTYICIYIHTYTYIHTYLYVWHPGGWRWFYQVIKISMTHITFCISSNTVLSHLPQSLTSTLPRVVLKTGVPPLFFGTCMSLTSSGHSKLPPDLSWRSRFNNELFRDGRMPILGREEQRRVTMRPGSWWRTRDSCWWRTRDSWQEKIFSYCSTTKEWYQAW
jgi:hypothetical protein